MDLIGTQAWGATVGYANALTIEFGEPHLERRKHLSSTQAFGLRLADVGAQRIDVRGRWSLWLHMAEWRLEWAGHELPAPPETYETDVPDLINGQELADIEIGLGGSVTVRFLSGLAVQAEAYPCADVSNPEEIALLLGPEEEISVSSNSSVRAKARSGGTRLWVVDQPISLFALALSRAGS